MFAIFAIGSVGGFLALGVAVRRLALAPLTPILAVVGYTHACLGIASGWALAGGRLFEFLLTPRTLVIGFGVLALTIGAIALEARVARRRDLWRLAVHGALLIAIVIATGAGSRWIPVVEQIPRDGASERPDVVVLSFDAMRPDLLREYVAANPQGHLAAVLSRGTSFVNVVAHGLSTDDTLSNNTFAGGPRDTCDGSLPDMMSSAGFFTAMLFAGVGRRFEGSVCYGYYFAGAGREAVRRYALPAVSRAIATGRPKVRDKNMRAPRLLERLDALAGNPRPIFAYAHFLELHAPYVPTKRRTDPAYRAALQEFLSRCYVVACDTSVPANAALVQTVRGAYVELLAEVDATVGRVLGLLRRRGRPFVVVITSDHGELFGEHGGFAHGGGFVPELLSIPFVVYDSRQEAAGRICEVLRSSEALRHVVLRAIGVTSELPKRDILELPFAPLGNATLDVRSSTLRYEVAPALRAQAGTWRNVHRQPTGTITYPLEACR